MQFFIRLFGLFLISWTYSLPLDSFLDVDGISVAAGTDHVCAIEAHADAPIGGKVRCWGNNEYGKLKPPKNVKFYYHINLLDLRIYLQVFFVQVVS